MERIKDKEWKVFLLSVNVSWSMISSEKREFSSKKKLGEGRQIVDEEMIIYEEMKGLQKRFCS